MRIPFPGLRLAMPVTVRAACVALALSPATAAAGDQRLLIQFRGDEHRVIQRADLPARASVSDAHPGADKNRTGQVSAIRARRSGARISWSGPDGPGQVSVPDPRILRAPPAPGQPGHEAILLRHSGYYSLIIRNNADLDTLRIHLPDVEHGGNKARRHSLTVMTEPLPSR